MGFSQNFIFHRFLYLPFFFQQNSLGHRQAISDALEESFATIDFGPEYTTDDDKSLVLEFEPPPVPVPQPAFERVTSVDESVTPYEDPDKSLPDWSMRTLPEPPSGFKDSIIMLPEIPAVSGPIKFSINSYTERSVNEEPYTSKIVRTESMREEHVPIKSSEQPVNPTAIENDSFILPRYNGNATINGE